MAISNIRTNINEEVVFARIAQLAKEHLLHNKNTVVRKGQHIEAFGSYVIKKITDAIVVEKHNKLVFTTSSTQYAFAWCIADKYQEYNLREDIDHYNRLIAFRSADIAHYKQALRSASKESQFVLLNRLEDAFMQLTSYKKQINKCIKVAKYRQQKGFDNETSRLGLDPVRKFSKDTRKSF